MSFSRMVELLKEKHKEKILFIKSGAFYIAIAQDAVFLSRLLSLKTTCFKKDVCKVAFMLVDRINPVHIIRIFNYATFSL